ncbi:multidrug resistance-associated protein 1-like [Haliotis rufescens]|uniref:multidrug resistance-associated protein 1-like n=1 Tax=Haliotis rufescens TaxID=6454 RepID=UPI00201E86CE|nr:multidrug resistance-associated protein 1-like [Haliotis rufescens]
MASLCNGTSVWDTNLTWYNTWPQFTDCFQSTVLVWVPCGWLWLTSPFYLYYLLNVTPTSLSSRHKYIAKLILCSCLVILSVIRLIDSADSYNTTIFSALFIAPAVQAVTFLFAVLLLLLERKKGLITSGVMFTFWLLLTVAGIVPFYSIIFKKQYERNILKVVTFYIYYGLVLLELILSCFAETSSGWTLQDKKLCPEVFASFVSRITFWWMNSLLLRGYRKPLTETDVYDIHPDESSVHTVTRFLPRWVKEINKSKRRANRRDRDKKVLYSKTLNESLSLDADDEKAPLLIKDKTMKMTEADLTPTTTKLSLIVTLWKTFWFDIIQSQLWRFVSDMVKFASPLILGLLVNFTTDGTIPTWKGYVLCAILSVATLTGTAFSQANWHQGRKVALRIAAVTISAIYRKSLRMSNKAKKNSTTGEIVNLMSVDVEHLRTFIFWAWEAWAHPLRIVIALYLLYQSLGTSVIAGMAVLFLLLPVTTISTLKWKKYQAQMMEQKDKRMKIMNEVLSGIKILKLYAWEPSFQERILEIRKQELHILWKISLMEVFTTFSWTLSPYLVSLATFATYIFISEDHYLRPDVVFTAMSLLSIVRLAVVSLPSFFSDLVQAMVSLRRINKFLNTEDLDDTQILWNSTQNAALTITDGCFQWTSEQGPTLTNINLTVDEGQLVAIVGQVGSGKSSLVSAVLGEMNKVNGHVSLKSHVAYVPQIAWIQNDTLQNNILFGKPMDRQWYDKVVECCALNPDLEMLPAGDMTEIGERGINMSGGQKQRVSLARAVYNNADIYLLDDPLSAVDSHVGKHIFDKVLSRKGLLAGKTRILVTHGIHWLPEVDSILVMTSCQISETGTYDQLLHHNGPFAQFLQKYLESNDSDVKDPEFTEIKKKVLQRLESVKSGEETDEESVTLMKSLMKSTELKQVELPKEKEPVSESSKLIEEEQVETGKVTLSVFLAYGRAIGLWIVLFSLIMYALFQATSITANTWLSKWTDDTSLNNMTLLPSNSSGRIEKNNYYLGVYGVLGVAQTVFIMTFSFLWNLKTVKASGILHLNMLRNVLKAPMSFFDTTPTGRIVNRFSQDMDTIDTRMPSLVEYATNTLFQVLSSIIVISFTTPIFLVVVVPLVVLYYFIQRFYVTTSRQLKRLESKARSPIYSHFGETLSGASVIRSFQAQSRFIKESEDRVDTNQRFSFYAFGALRWQGVRLEIIGNIIVLAASLFAVMSRDTLSGGLVGLSITYAIEITANLNWMVQLVSEVETQIVAVERVKEYTEIDSEPAWNVPERRPNKDWPQTGVVKFLDYSTRYRDGLDLVLKGITCTVHSKEKVGIVGRTGAGKSSLTLSLFRLIEAAGGEINIDGVDVSTLGLHDLRSKLTILPQDPVLFAGSLRDNVDPFNQYSDNQIWRALAQAHLKTFVETLPDGLEHECSEGGENMSVGQRQLLCLARALLKKTRILVLDEATAAVDMETDDLIQQTIRSEFKDCTVLTIAHRLNTVMDYDRILVLDNGCVCEFDTPSSLLQQPDSIFYNMAKAAGLT